MSTINNKRTMTVNGRPVPIEGEKNILDLIRKAGFDSADTYVTTHSFPPSARAGCASSKTKEASILASCSTPPKAGMDIKDQYTETERIQER